MIELITETTLKFINNSAYKIFEFTVFKYKRIGNLDLTFKSNFKFVTI